MIDEMIMYTNFRESPLLGSMDPWLRYEGEKKGFRWREELFLESNRPLVYHWIQLLTESAGRYGFRGNLWHCCLTDLLVKGENSYSVGCEGRGAIEGTVNAMALHDLTLVHHLMQLDFGELAEGHKVPELLLCMAYVPSAQESGFYNKRICGVLSDLAMELGKAKDPEDMKTRITEFYRCFGVGKFGLHKSFRVISGEGEPQIVPILNIKHVKMSDLVGYESAKAKLIENTDAFVEGRRTNNVLLFGDAGTGKSSCIKAIANEYFDRGLRVIELYKHQFRDLNAIIAQIKQRNYRFVIYMDDLSFEDFETDYKYLKAVIEGGLEKRPENVVIYATSNRRHLIRENFSDRDDDDKTGTDTVQEKLSLSYRFGVTIYFGKPDKPQFQEIVRVLAAREGIDLPEDELLLEANKWELSHGGLSGRTAQQFIDHLLGRRPADG